MNCPNCFEQESIITTPTNELVCEVCGSCIENEVNVLPITSELFCYSSCSASNSYYTCNTGGTINDKGNGSKTLQKLHLWQLDQRDRTLSKYCNELEITAQLLDNCTKTVIDIAKKHFKEQFINKKKVMRRKSINCLMAGSVYLALKKTSPTPAGVVTKVFGITKGDLSKYLNNLSILNSDTGHCSSEEYSKHIDPCTLLPALCSKLKLPYCYEKEAKTLLNHNKHLQENVSSVCLADGVLYFLLSQRKVHFDKTVFSSSDSTLRKVQSLLAALKP